MTNVVKFKQREPKPTKDQHRLAEIVMEVFDGKKDTHLFLAIDAGYRALNRGASLFEAVDVAEVVINDLERYVSEAYAAEMERRAWARLVEWRIKQSVWRYLPDRSSK